MDLFIVAAEPSGDLHGSKLIDELLKKNPNLKIAAVAGPKMRSLPIHALFDINELQVMGFIDVILSLPKIIKFFFKLRKTLLNINPKAIVFIDYPGFNLRMEKSLRKNGYKGKLIHYISPTVWAWGKKRVQLMEKNLDLLFTIFPFEKKFFNEQNLSVHYVGHPLTQTVENFKNKNPSSRKNILAIFPGSREKEIHRNLPIQLKVAQKLKQLDPSLQIVISNHKDSQEKNYKLMQEAKMALATSGTVNLELALHATATVVNYAIHPIDCWLAQKIFKIKLPFYCIVNILQNKEVFKEFFGPNMTEGNLFLALRTLWFDENLRKACEQECENLKKTLGNHQAAQNAASILLSNVDF